jgi:tellurite resistance protein TehA-like permease
MMTTDIKPILEGMRPLSRLDHPREMIRQFTPNWFAATMGTGILALALPQMPGIGASLKPVGEVMWFFNIGLFSLFTALYTARWILFGHEARRIFGHNTVSMFIGTIPMGLATIINGCSHSVSRASARASCRSPRSCGGSTPPWR